MPNIRDEAARTVAVAHIAMYRATGGVLGGFVGGLPVLLLVTKGRRTGEMRTSPLTYIKVDGRIFVIASYGGANRHPAWYLNLADDPNVEVQRWRTTTAATARTISGDDREHVWSRVIRRAPIYRWYQSQTDREIPVVELVPDGDSTDGVETAPEVDLEAMTKAELLTIAAALDVPGRSKMNKAALIDALQARESEIGDAARGI